MASLQNSMFFSIKHTLNLTDSGVSWKQHPARPIFERAFLAIMLGLSGSGIQSLQSYTEASFVKLFCRIKVFVLIEFLWFVGNISNRIFKGEIHGCSPLALHRISSATSLLWMKFKMISSSLESATIKMIFPWGLPRLNRKYQRKELLWPLMITWRCSSDPKVSFLSIKKTKDICHSPLLLACERRFRQNPQGLQAI